MVFCFLLDVYRTVETAIYLNEETEREGEREVGSYQSNLHAPKLVSSYSEMVSYILIRKVRCLMRAQESCTV